MDDTLQLTRSDTYAKLSSSDLETMGKMASSTLLCSGTPLNDSIIKLAKEHPSISPHQVRRVVEYANQETFAQLFEKQAGDKNVEFDVADPGAVLQALDLSARPSSFAVSSDYDSSPTKMAYSDVEADRELTKLFLGVDFATPGSEKTAAILARRQANGELHIERIMDVGDLEKNAVDRILLAGEEGTVPDSGAALSQDMIPDAGAEESSNEEAVKEGMGPAGYMLGAGQVPQENPEVSHQQNMRALDRQIELEEKKQELINLQAKEREALMEANNPGMMQPQQPAQQQQQAVQGAPTAPSMPTKMASELTKQAMQYVKMGRAKAEVVLDDLKKSVSLDNIKEAIAKQAGYPEADPFGDLLRAKQKVAMLQSEVISARDKNSFMMKEAEDEFHHHVTQHMLNGGGLGEIVHLMDQVSNDNVITKKAAESLVEHLIGKGLDITKTQANMITYEMEKSASQRVVNPDNPMARVYASFVKLSQEQPVLEYAVSDLTKQRDSLEQALQEAMQSASSI
jgi:hypothetical protein